MNEKELTERIENIRDVMTTQGWKDLLEGWTEELTRLRETTLTECNDAETLYFRKGAYSVLDRLVNLDKYLDTIEAALASGVMPDEE
jgi:hypothetical protein